MQPIQAKLGADRRLKVTLGAGTYTGAETLTAAIWPGDDQAAVITPTCTWIDPEERTLSVAWTADDTEDLAPGRYPLELAITASGQVTRLDVAVVEFLATPGAGTARPAYCTFDNLRVEAGSWLDSLQGDSTTQAGFAEERAEAREEFERLLHALYDGPSTTGIGWPGYLPTREPMGRSTWLTEQLAADALLVRSDVRRWNVLWSLYLVCKRQIGKDAKSPYRTMAAEYLAEASALAKTITAELDTDGDGEGEIAIHLGTIRTLRA